MKYKQYNATQVIDLSTSVSKVEQAHRMTVSKTGSIVRNEVMGANNMIPE